MGSDDWGRFTPYMVDVRNILNRFPKHKNCVPVIKSGPSIFQPYGLYCKQHGTLFQWINWDQIQYLKDTWGIDDLR